MKKFFLLTSLFCVFVWHTYAQEFFEKHLVFPKGATLEEKVDMASRLVPSDRQLEWQQMELTAFLHFGINTFTGREWGDGKEDPALFNPSSLDCEQWVRALKDAGFKMAILTAKHHDGFCLWPTKTTKHSVASSPWKNGKGDVVRELRDACKKYGLKFGVYLSPWDRNAACYGQGDAYNKFFIEQLTELLTDYGEVHEVWFDGANGEGPNGKKQIYDWVAIEKTIRTLQPKAVTAIMGDDVRWVGNEKGIGRETEWSATVLAPGIYARSEEQNKRLNVFQTAKDLGGRDVLNRADELFWYPSEVDVSIRPGWFYHANQDDQVKSLAHLADIYFKSVGYNSVLLLNIPPDKNGLIHESDCRRLKELSVYLKHTFDEDFLKKGNRRWLAVSGASTEYSVRKNALVNTFMLQEEIAKGQRIESFSIEGWMDGAWQLLAAGTTVGYKRLVRFAACQPEKIRLTIHAARGEARIIRTGLYYARPLSNHGSEVQLGNVPVGQWSIVGNDEDARKAIDGNINSVWRKAGLVPLVIDLGRDAEITGFTYAPASDDNLLGTIYKYAFYVSRDGESWTLCNTTGEFSNIMHNPVPYVVQFEKSYRGRYVKLVPLAEISGKSYTSVAEIGVFTVSLPLEDDELAVYPIPGAPLALNPGDNHPSVKGWKFFTAHEFLDRDTNDGLPKGFVEHRGKHMSRSAKVDNVRCSEVKDGVLHIYAKEEPDSIDNGFGKRVKYSHGCYRSITPTDKNVEFWCNFTENMRIEIRFKRNAYQGFNDALWFMGNNGKPWPANGEIDLLENPKKKVNNRAHFTLHSENYFANIVGGKGSVTSSIQLEDMSDWNIYWLEWYEDRMVGGVNGKAYFTHKKGDQGNVDWPWSDPAGFYLIFSTGISTNPNSWPGAVNSQEWKKEAGPDMCIDWVRVYVNDDYHGAPASEVKYY